MQTTPLADQTDIADLLVRYAFAIDDKEWDVLLEVFCDDCTADYGRFGSFEGAAAVASWMAEAHVGLTSHHSIANVSAIVDGDQAKVRSYVTVSIQPDGAPLIRTGGEYRDLLRRVEGRWRIASRTYTTIWQEDGRRAES